MSLIYRIPKQDDFEAVFGLLEQLWPTLHLSKENTNGVFLRCLESDNDCLLCAEHEGKVVGFGAGCKRIELDSGFHREQAHKMYEHIGFNKRAFLFSKEIV